MPAQLNKSIEWRISDEPVDYAVAVQEMEARAAAVAAGSAPELIWILEHPHIYTAGTSAKPSDVLQARCPVLQTGRGGQVTYHGPGQTVVYAILDLNRRGKDIRAYVRQLEQWVIDSLQQLGLICYRREGRVGLWVPRNKTTDDKIAAIGVRVKKWITLHGLSINLNPDLTYYQGIIPCGISDHGVTSLQALGIKAERAQLDQALQEAFAAIF